MENRDSKHSFNVEKGVAIVFLVINFIVFLLPYLLRGYKVPVGWDTPIYIWNMRIIDEYGILYFIKFRNYPYLYSILEYGLSWFFHIPFIVTETFLPICMGVFLSFINFFVVKKISGSRKLAILSLGLSIITPNIARIVVDLHRNLFSMILLTLALFVVVPELFVKTTRKKMGLFIVLMVSAGLSQVESFMLAVAMLSFLVVFLSSVSWQKAKCLFLLTILSVLIVALIMAPNLSIYLSRHHLFDASKPFIIENYASKPIDYIRFLGGPLIPLLFFGILSCFSRFKRPNPDILSLTIFIYTITLIVASFLPWLNLKILGWRCLLMVNIPIISAVGIQTVYDTTLSLKLSMRDEKIFLKIRSISALISFANIKILFIASTLLLSLLMFPPYFFRTYRPWISNSAYEKLIFISEDAIHNEENIVVINFNIGQYTNGTANLYNEWVKAIIGPNTYVYFGTLNALFLKLEKSFPENSMSRFLPPHERDPSINASIYIIDEWYPSFNASFYVYGENIYPGIYRIKPSFKAENLLLLLNPYTDKYNFTVNAYGRRDNWTRTWAKDDWILEVFQDPFAPPPLNSTPKYFQLSFLVPMSDELVYTLRVRWFNWSPFDSPMRIRLDDIDVATLSYHDISGPETIEISLPTVKTGWHIIVFEIFPDPSKRTHVSIHYVEVVPQV